MRNYELAFIIQPTVDDEGVTNVVDQVTQYVQAINGEVASVDVWGRRNLAYPIKNYREGVYVLFQAKLSPDSLVELERNLKLSEDVIRYLLVKVED